MRNPQKHNRSMLPACVTLAPCLMCKSALLHRSCCLAPPGHPFTREGLSNQIRSLFPRCTFCVTSTAFKSQRWPRATQNGHQGYISSRARVTSNNRRCPADLATFIDLFAKHL